MVRYIGVVRPTAAHLKHFAGALQGYPYEEQGLPSFSPAHVEGAPCSFCDLCVAFHVRPQMDMLSTGTLVTSRASGLPRRDSGCRIGMEWQTKVQAL